LILNIALKIGDEQVETATSVFVQPGRFEPPAAREPFFKLWTADTHLRFPQNLDSMGMAVDSFR
jgi:hypothetical protein